MKKLNQSNYVIQRSPRTHSFVVHGDRICDYNGGLEDTAWPVFPWHTDQSTQVAEQPVDPYPGSHNRQRPIACRKQGRSRAQPLLATGQDWDLHARPPDAQLATATTSALQQPGSSDSIPATDTLTYLNEAATTASPPHFGPITGPQLRRSGRQRRPPAKLRALAASRAVAVVRSASVPLLYVLVIRIFLIVDILI